MDVKSEYKLKRELAAFFRTIGDSLRNGESVDQFFDKSTANEDDLKALLASEDFEIIEIEKDKNRILTKIAIFTENEDYQNLWIRLLENGNDIKIYAITYHEVDRSVLEQDEELGLGIERPKLQSLIEDIVAGEADLQTDLENC